jgi:hypothetical protein
MGRQARLIDRSESGKHMLKRTAGRRPDGSFTCQITRGNAYATASRVVRDTPYAITARRALLIAAPDDPEPLAPMCGVPLMYDVALSHSMIPSCHAIQL